MAQYELSRTLAKFLDKHLCFPLLEFLQDRGVYNEDDILKAKIELLQNTNMVDFAMDIYKELYQSNDVPAFMHDRRSQVVQRLRTLQKAVEPIIGCLSNNNVIKNFRHVFQQRQQEQQQVQRHRHCSEAMAAWHCTDAAAEGKRRCCGGTRQAKPVAAACVARQGMRSSLAAAA